METTTAVPPICVVCRLPMEEPKPGPLGIVGWPVDNEGPKHWECLRAQYVERSRTEYVDRHVSVTEKRAPTDESVKLLREMEAKAEAEIVKAVQVGNQKFECVVHQSLDAMSDQMRWRAIFNLNGKQMVAEVSLNTTERDPIAPFAKLRDETAKVIAGEVLDDAFCAVLRQRFGGPLPP